MPVFDLTTGWVNPANRPPWSALSAVGRFRVPAGGGRFDRHYHRTDEIWLIDSGKAKVVTDGSEHYVQGGDVVVTQAGDTHDFVEVYEEVRGYFVEMGPPRPGQSGHLHRDPADAEGHAVPLRSEPADFPARPVIVATPPHGPAGEARAPGGGERQ